MPIVNLDDDEDGRRALREMAGVVLTLRLGEGRGGVFATTNRLQAELACHQANVKINLYSQALKKGEVIFKVETNKDSKGTSYRVIPGWSKGATIDTTAAYAWVNKNSPVVEYLQAENPEHAARQKTLEDHKNHIADILRRVTAEKNKELRR